MNLLGKSILSLLLATMVTSSALADAMRYEFVESSRSIMRVGPNQSLDLLIEQMYPAHKELWPRIRQELKRLNPHAFNRYTGRLMEGHRLKLVTVKVIRESDVPTLTQAGTVTSIQGYAVATDRTGRESRLAKNSIVYQGDRLNTAPNAELVVQMIDDAQIHLREDSSVRVTEYVMKSGFDSGSRSIIDLIKGGLRKITGAIGANPLSVYRFHAGVLTIGVRGTDFVVKLCKANDCTQSASRNDQNVSMHVAVLDGLITLQDEEGVQGELALGQYAVARVDKIVQVDDAEPVPGLLNVGEQELFDSMKPPADTKEEESRTLWPWLIGGALLGL